MWFNCHVVTDFCKEKPNSSTGNTVSQLEAPFSVERSMALCRSGGSLDFSSLAEDDCLARFLFLISATADSWSERVAYVYLLSWLRIDDTIGVVISIEAWNSWLAVLVGFRIPNPPNLHGKASRSLTSSLGAGIPLSRDEL